MDGVAHLADFGEQDGGAGAHQEIGGESHGGIAGDAGEGVAAAALQADDQIGCGTGWRRRRSSSARRRSAAARMAVRRRRRTAVVLEAEDVGFGRGSGSWSPRRRRLHFSQPRETMKGFAQRLGWRQDVAQGADGDGGAGCVDGHAAAVGVGEGDDVIDVGEAREEFRPDAADGVIDRGGDALHGSGDAQDIARGGGAIGVAKAFESEAGKGW